MPAQGLPFWCSVKHVFECRFFDDTELGKAVDSRSPHSGFSPFQWCCFVKLLVPFTYLSLILPDLDDRLHVDAWGAFKAHMVSPSFSIPFSQFFMSGINRQSCASTPAFLIPNYSETQSPPSLLVCNPHPCAACSHLHKCISLSLGFVGADIDVQIFLVQHPSAILGWTMWMVHKNRPRRMHQAHSMKKEKKGQVSKGSSDKSAVAGTSTFQVCLA